MQKNQALFITGLIFAIFIILFTVTNANPVVVNVFFFKFKTSQALIIFLSTALGAIIVTLMGLISHIKMKREIKKLSSENEVLNKKLQMIEIKTEKNEKVIASDELAAKKINKTPLT